jgi:hypothetical protein
MVSELETTVVATEVVPKAEFRPKTSRNESRGFRTCTCASTPIGSIVSDPARVGTSATRLTTAVAYCTPFRINCSTAACPCGVASSTQKPCGSGTFDIPKLVTSTRVQIRYSTTKGSPSNTEVLDDSAVMNRSSGARPVAGSGPTGVADTVTSIGAVE